MERIRERADAAEAERKEADVSIVWTQYEKGIDFKNQINLYETVRNNENFYIGKQWEGVVSNGLPTPVFNFIKRVILFLVASTATDNAKMSASPLPSSGMAGSEEVERVCSIVNDQFEALFEQNKVGKLVRDFMRNAAVDGDACLYCWFDPEAETGQTAKGTIRAELLENTRVIFGNPNSRSVQKQPYLLISRREPVEEVKRRAEQFRGQADQIRLDTDEAGDRFDAMADGRVTTLLKLWKDRKSGTVYSVETTKDAVVRPEWDTKLERYPLVWMNWDYVQNCYHGQAAVTGLIPNQIFVNKLFALTMISLMTTAYPKVLYDKVRIAKWDARVGTAIGVDAGDGNISNVAKVMDPAPISAQVHEFIELAVSMTKECMGATDAAMGNVKPDNTSAIIALQKSSSVPLEIVKQDLYQSIEDMGNIWLDMMRAYYGLRYVETPATRQEEQMAALLGMEAETRPTPFDFSALGELPLSLKLDVGGSAYWSEIAQMQTLDNLLTQGKIDTVDYLERVPNGYISNQQELIDTLKQRQAAAVQPMAHGPISAPAETEASITAGMNTLRQKILQQGAEGLKIAR